jgi:hypothetical protein
MIGETLINALIVRSVTTVFATDKKEIKMSDYLFTISVLDDDSYIVASYDNALDAITEYNKYIDHGNAHIRRVVLNEPNGNQHSKIFTALGTQELP